MSFAAQMKAFEDLTTDKAEKVFRKTCFEISNSVISLTAVDSGRAKNNWFPDINNFSNNTTENTDKTGKQALSNVQTKTKSLQLGNTFTLSNNLDYIEKLEYGWSKQSPNGMVGITLQKFDTILKNVNKGTR